MSPPEPVPSPGAVHPRAAFQHPDFRLSLGAGVASVLGMQMQSVAIGWQVYQVTGELFDLGLPPLTAALPGLSTGRRGPVAAVVTDAVQRVYLAFLASRPDSHIVRKHGAALAHSVMGAAQRWQDRALAGAHLDADPGFVAWDLELKAAGLNPGTSADFTVAALFIAGLVAPRAAAR